MPEQPILRQEARDLIDAILNFEITRITTHYAVEGSSEDIPADVDGNGIVNSFDRLRTNQNQGTSLLPPPLP